MEGIYVIGMSTGVVKVGRSRDLSERLRQHANHLEQVGVAPLEVWTRAVDSADRAERRLLALLAAHPTAQYAGAGRETWRGIGVAEVVTLAATVLADPALLAPPESVPDPIAPRQAVDLAAALERALELVVDELAVPVGDVRRVMGRTRLAAVQSVVKSRTVYLASRRASIRAYPVAALRDALERVRAHRQPVDMSTG